MRENFIKLRKKFMLNAVFESVFGGIFTGLAAVGITLILLKLNGVNLHFALYILIGVLCAASVGAGIFFIVKPTDKRIAKKLDRDYALNEKAQTMVANSGKEGAIITLQREDADEKLGSLKLKKPGAAKIIRYIAVPVVAFALVITAAFLPMAIIDPGAEEPNFEISDWQAASLEQLIKDVKSSDLSDTAKGLTVENLENLLSDLKKSLKVSEMKSSVVAAIKNIDDAIYAENSYTDLCRELIKVEAVKFYGQVAEGAIVVFKASGARISKYAQVTQLRSGLDGAVVDFVNAGMNNKRDEAAELSGSMLKAKISEISAGITAALVNSEVSESDALYAAYSAFSASLAGLTEKIASGSYGSGVIKNELISVFDGCAKDISAPLGLQSYNCLMDEFIRNCLADIFKLSSDEIPSVSYTEGLHDNGGKQDDDEDKKGGTNPGGFGDGDTKYGSDDIVYDPDKEEYRQYGEILADYNAKITELLRSDELDEEAKEYIRKYFSILYNGFESTDNGNSENG